MSNLTMFGLMTESSYGLFGHVNYFTTICSYKESHFQAHLICISLCLCTVYNGWLVSLLLFPKNKKHTVLLIYRSHLMFCSIKN
jgi:hypothetical protein